MAARGRIQVAPAVPCQVTCKPEGLKSPTSHANQHRLFVSSTQISLESTNNEAKMARPIYLEIAFLIEEAIE